MVLSIPFYVVPGLRIWDTGIKAAGLMMNTYNNLKGKNQYRLTGYTLYGEMCQQENDHAGNSI